MLAKKTLALIAKTIEEAQEKEHRSHLGASVLGDTCRRKIWYGFRWVYKEQHDARLLRLFNRGHLAEDRFVGYLRAIGCQVWQLTSEGQQWRVNFAGAHGGGSVDAVARGIPELKNEPFLCEFKTHNDKSFAKLQDDGVASSKPEHFAQMQVYMHGLGLAYALYLAVNKNDDSIYAEIVRYSEAYAKTLIAKAEEIIRLDSPPEKVSQTPSFFKCKFCAFSQHCHFPDKVMPERNCRTCEHVICDKENGWSCALTSEALSVKAQHEGCKKYQLSEWLKNGTT